MDELGYTPDRWVMCGEGVPDNGRKVIGIYIDEGEATRLSGSFYRPEWTPEPREIRGYETEFVQWTGCQWRNENEYWCHVAAWRDIPHYPEGELREYELGNRVVEK